MSFDAQQEANPFEQADSWDVPLEKMLKEGNYVCRVAEVSDESAKSSGRPKLVVRFVAENGSGAIRAFESYHCGFLRKIATLYRSAGVQLPRQDEFDPNDNCRIKTAARERLVSARVGVLVREEVDTDPQTGLPRTRTNVAGYCDPTRIAGGADTNGLPEPGADAQAAVPGVDADGDLLF